jgi:hypothetical protein
VSVEDLFLVSALSLSISGLLSYFENCFYFFEFGVRMHSFQLVEVLELVTQLGSDKNYIEFKTFLAGLSSVQKQTVEFLYNTVDSKAVSEDMYKKLASYIDAIRLLQPEIKKSMSVRKVFNTLDYLSDTLGTFVKSLLEVSSYDISFTNFKVVNDFYNSYEEFLVDHQFKNLKAPSIWLTTLSGSR